MQANTLLEDDMIQSGLWDFVPWSQYVKPREPTGEVMRKGIFGLWDRLWRAPEKTKEKVVQTELREVDQSMLNRIIPVPNWKEAVPALNGALSDWLNTDHPECPFRIVLGAPHSGVSEILECLGETPPWRILRAPSTNQILAGGDAWISRIPDSSNAFLIIPHLEHYYLRHYEGLDLMRKLVDKLLSFSGRCIIGCDTWAWAYLNMALQLESFLPEPLTLAAFDRERLERCFQPPSTEGSEAVFRFRQTDNGKFVLLPVKGNEKEAGGQQKGGEEKKGEGEKVEVTDFLNHVAAFSRGILGIALAVWKYSLRLAPEEEANEKVRQTAAADRGNTIWVRPWNDLDLPVLPRQMDRDLYFVLDAILLHGGLSTQLLSHLLPLAPPEILRTLHLSRAAGLLALEKGVWHIPALGYPAVRQFLASGGYLVDAV